jgi:hypothetical protein
LLVSGDYWIIKSSYLLTETLWELTVLGVVHAADPIRRIRSCPLGIKDHISLCPLHRRLDEAVAMVETALKQSTIAELLVEPDRRRGVPVPLCAWPAEAESGGKQTKPQPTAAPREGRWEGGQSCVSWPCCTGWRRTRR